MKDVNVTVFEQLQCIINILSHLIIIHGLIAYVFNRVREVACVWQLFANSNFEHTLVYRLIALARLGLHQIGQVVRLRGHTHHLVNPHSDSEVVQEVGNRDYLPALFA